MVREAAGGGALWVRAEGPLPPAPRWEPPVCSVGRSRPGPVRNRPQAEAVTERAETGW